MDNAENKLTPQQYRKYNGQSIMAAFKSMGNRATLDDLSACIARSIQQPEDYVRNEVENVLNRGVDEGFLLKRDHLYVLVGSSDYQIDFQVNNEPKVSEPGELAELKERQKLRNDLEISLYRMSTAELRKLHRTYVQRNN